MKRIVFLFFCVLTVCLWTGCGSVTSTTVSTGTKINNPDASFGGTEDINEQIDTVGMLEAPETDYELPKSVSAICVDLEGYLPDSDKEAVVFGEILPTFFEIKRVDDDETVFSKEIAEKAYKNAEGEEEKINSVIISFTEFVEPGTYYIETSNAGRSENFSIGEDVLSELLNECFEGLYSLKYDCANADGLEDEVCLENNPNARINVAGGWFTGDNYSRDTATGAIAALDMMMSYEYHSAVYPDKYSFDKTEGSNGIPDILDDIRYEIDWIIKMQNPKTGGVYNGVIPDENNEYVICKETTRATAYACAALERFSYLILKYDKEYSGVCYQAAAKAWKCLEANRSIVSDDQMFRASVEMYRASGRQEYMSVIEAYLKNNVPDISKRIVLDGAITYMATPRHIDVSACDKLMASLMQRTEDKSEAAHNNPYMVEDTKMDMMSLLRNSYELVMVDYIINSKEYSDIEMDYLHYFCGRNKDGVKLLDNQKNPDVYAQFIVLAGKLTDRR